ncbi:hypothetical protein ACJ7K1_27770 [Paenibacillus elgii]
MEYLVGIGIYLILALIPVGAVIIAFRAKKKYLKEKRQREIQFALNMEKILDQANVPEDKRELIRKSYK